MRKLWFKLCSLLLVTVLLVNMLPLQTFAEQLNTEDMSLVTPGADTTEKETATGKIVEELIDKRTEYTKQFRMDNGLFIAAVYNDPVHYEKDGQWLEIDNTLKTQKNGTYINTAGVWNVSFPNQLTRDNRISVTKDTYTLSFSMAGELRTGEDFEVMSAEDPVAPAAVAEEVLSPSALIEGETAETFAVSQAQASTAQLETVDVAALKAEAEHPEMVADKLSSGLMYSNVYGTTDIRYQLNSNKVKESIILESYSSTLRGYRYTLEVGDLNPALQEDGSIYFYDAENKEIVMVMEAPFLVDDAFEYSYDIQVQLTGSGSTYTLTYLLPTSWLASADRVYPVVLDPVITANLAATNIQDQTVASKTTYSHTRGINECGYCQVDGIQRFYLKYNTIPALTSSDVVVYAQMDMHKFVSGTTATVQVHKVLEFWKDDTITWADQPACDPTIEDYQIAQAEAKYTWDVTDIVRSWYETGNYGMMFRVNDAVENGTTNNWKQFYSSNYSNSPNHMPALQIVFRNNNGLESYWDYTASSAGRAGTGYVNNYTGNLVWIRGDIGFGGNRMPVAISHVYNANDAFVVNEDVNNSNNSNDTAGNAFGLGNGWRTNYHQLVYKWSKDSNYYVWEDSDGTDHYFKHSSGNIYKDEDGLELTLKTSGSGSSTTYTITDKNGNTSYFDSSGRLIKLENNQATKSSVNIQYAGTSKRIAKITDGVGREYEFHYNSASLLEFIRYMGDPDREEPGEVTRVTFGYEDSNLTTVTDKDEGVSRYSYGTKNLLTSVTDIDEYKLTYTYSTSIQEQPARVRTVTEQHNADGGMLTFDYQHNQTTITDRNGNKQILQFNNFGNTISIQDGQGRAQYAQFAKNDANDTGKANQLTVASKLQYTVGNIASDSSFESSTLWALDPSDAAATYRTSSTAFHGVTALRLETTDAANMSGTEFTIPAGASYTFSAYIKVAAGSAKLVLREADSNDMTYSEADSNDLAYSEASTSSTWTRLEVSYTNNGTAAVNVAPILNADAGTTVYMDCVQIENAPTASRYNLVENGDFQHDFDNWTKIDCATTGTIAQATRQENGVTVADPAAPQLDATVFHVTGTPLYRKQLSQTVQVSGAANDTFVFAGWAKGNSAPLRGEGDEARRFGIEVSFNYTGGEQSDTFTAQFNPDSTEWQYVSAAAVAKHAYSSVTIRLLYENNVNAVSFDGIQLFKEQFGSSYTYDANGNVTSVIDLQNQQTTYEYTDNDLTKIIEPGNKITEYTYDNYHNVLTATSATGVVYNFEYDQYGNNIKVSVGSGETKIVSSATYAYAGNYPATVTDALGNVTTYTHNETTGVLEKVQYPNNTDTTDTEYKYDELFRMEKVTAATNTGLNMIAQYEYTNDLLTKIQTGSTTYNFSYGNFALRSSVKVGTQTLATYTYTQDGNNYLSSLDYGNGDKVQYEYDNQGRVTKQTYKDHQTSEDEDDTVTYQYDNSGALATVTDSATGRKTTYYYDFTDRLMKYVESGSDYHHSVDYNYDAENKLTSLVETVYGLTRTTDYAYDKDNRVTRVTNGSTNRQYVYDAYGRLETESTLYGTTTLLTSTYNYRNINGKATAQVSELALSGAISRTYAYEYDDNGNIVRITDPTGATEYIYDSANQLIREDNEAAGFTHTWTYDNAGNIRTRKEYAYTTGSLENVTPTKTITYTYGNTNWGDLLMAYDGKTITYDAIGNPLNDGTWDYTWKHGRQLATMSNEDETWTYTYNADGLRTSREGNTYTYSYVYNGGQLTGMKRTKESNGATETLWIGYDANGPMFLKTNSGTYQYVTNLQGDVVALLDSGGNVVVEYTYDAWGNLLSTTGSLAETLGKLNPLRYRGYVYDFETGLYYLQSRYYDPETGRFLNADAFASTGQGLLGNNMFAYCRNNPVIRKDTFGTEDVCVENFNDDNNPFNDLGSPSGGGGGGSRVADVSSSYYARQNVKVYDAWWRNSPYNPNMTWSNGATSQQTAQGDPFDSFAENPQNLNGKTESDMSEILGDTWTQGTYGTKGNGWKFYKGDRLIAYHPGGGRHVGSYYVISSTSTGRMKLVGPDYLPTLNDKAIIIWVS